MMAFLFKNLPKIFIFGLLLFVNAVKAQNEVESTKLQLLENSSSLSIEAQRLSQRDIDEMKVSSAYKSPTTGWFHLYFNQAFQEIEVYNALLNIVLKKDNIVNVTNQFVPKIEKLGVNADPVLSASMALTAAANHLNINVGNPILLSSNTLKNGLIEEVVFLDESFTKEKIKVKLYWLPSLDNQTIRLVWNVNIQIPATNDWWNVRIDAQTGEFVEKNNWTVFCDFGNHQSVKADCLMLQNPNAFAPKEQISFKNLLPQNALVANSYTVFDIGLEAPTFGSRTVVTDPYTRFVPAGTGPGVTNGWHDNGTTAFTHTQGNNVLAQDDLDNSNSTAGTRPNSNTLEFNYPYTFGPGTPPGNLNAAITNLFYWNNVIHDVLYKYGFDEAGGNFQANNMARGGLGNDFVNADAQDAGGINNANFSTPVDGSSGRMQMYLWSGTIFTVNSPSNIAANYTALESGFSINNKLTSNITGNLILVNDAGTATTALGCLVPFDNAASIVGKIAVIDRGSTCNYATKVKNAQNAGAIACIVVNNTTTAPTTLIMTGLDNSITIPAFFISQTTGNLIKTQLNAGQTVSVTLATKAYQPDGDFDNGIISHEYGHGWSIRLTGGPANSSCLANAEQMGEGWGDYLGLMLATDWAAQTATIASANVPRGIGTYAIGQATTGGGIRPFPYSYNMAGVNPTVTYSGVANTATYSQPHGIGSIWCTILWDMTWEIIFHDNQVVSDISNTSNLVGNAAAFKLVNEGLRLQKCSPSFIDGRDAILKADEMLFNGKYKCTIWKAFARRGVGVNASTGTSSADRVVTQDFSMPAGISLKKTVFPLSQNEGGKVTFTITATCGCIPRTETIVDGLPSSLTYVAGTANNGGVLIGSTVTWANQVFAAKEVKVDTFDATVGTGIFANTFQAINDDFDGSSPIGSWLTGVISGTTNWANNTTTVHSGANSIFALNAAATTDFTLTTGVDYALSGPALLSFWHRFDTEKDWDGGVVELTQNNGATWIDLGPYFVSNGYNGTLSGVGRRGFSGASGWILSQINLETFCGQTVKIRFRMISDSNTDCAPNTNCGWFVDDIILNVPSGINNIANTLNGVVSNACLQVTQGVNPIVQVKVFLQNVDILTNTMDDYVKTLSNFPLTDPYAAAPFSANYTHVNNGGTAVTTPIALAATGNDAIVDWVFLELRTGAAAATSVVSTRAALLQKDGDVVDIDGVSPVKFIGATSGNYYVAVRHRNYLGFRTSTTFTLTGTPTVLNFTNNSVTVYGATPLYPVTPSIYSMVSGDSNSDGSIDAFDTILWEIQNGLFDDYTNIADYNMDGSVDAFDSIFWEINNGKFQELD